MTCEEVESREIDLEGCVPDGFATSDELGVSIKVGVDSRDVEFAGRAGEGIDEGWDGCEGASEGEEGEVREARESEDRRRLDRADKEESARSTSSLRGEDSNVPSLTFQDSSR